MGNLDSLRYGVEHELRQHGDRSTCIAVDRATDRRVVLKTDTPSSIAHEARVLDALPPATGPQLVDVIWSADGHLTLALELLEGRSLGDAAQSVGSEALPALAIEICQTLGQLHRAGITHADLKPSNILVGGTAHARTVRLIDFGFALAPFSDPEDAAQELGGTVGYIAPELLRRWAIDHRADQFSLGVILREICAAHDGRERWDPILARLCARLPAHRFADILAAADAIADQFGLPPSRHRRPSFFADSSRFRSPGIEQLREALGEHPGERVLIQARPRVGLPRILRAAVLEQAARGGPKLVSLDLGAFDSPRARDWAERFLDRCKEARMGVLLGVADPSPGFHWLPAEQAEWARLVTRDIPRRLRYDGLGEVALTAIVGDALGTGGEEVERLGGVLAQRSAGDLHLVRDGLEAVVRTAAEREGLRWRLRAAELDLALAAWSPAPPPPTLEQAPAGQRRALCLLARGGPSLSEALAARLLNHFQMSELLAQLLDRGYLIRSGAERVEFITAHLYREALSVELREQARIDAWLLEHQTPRNEDAGEVIRSCRRAARLGRTDVESDLLARAVAAAELQRRGRDLRLLLAYPEPEPAPWTEQKAIEVASRLTSTLIPHWNQGRILNALARAVYTIDPALACRLLERTLSLDDSEAGADALLQLLNHTSTRGSDEEFARLRQCAEAREEAGRGLKPGVVDSFLARRAWRQGDPARAEELGTIAAERMRGGGSLYEAFNLQMLAILRFARDASGAKAIMERALESARDPEHQAQLSYNLCNMYIRTGDYEAAARCADAAIEGLRGRVSPELYTGLRIHRLETWTDLNRVDRAISEAHNLLGLSSLRALKTRHVYVRVLLGLCHLRGKGSQQAIAECAGAWEQMREDAELSRQTMRTDILRILIDVLLDLEAWPTVREREESLALGRESAAATDLTVAARADALKAQASGDLIRAKSILAEREPLARTLTERSPAARYLHHLGCVELAIARSDSDAGAARRASDLFREVISFFPGPGHEHNRSRALLCLALALECQQETDSALDVLDDAVTLCRRSGGLGTLARCLEARVRIVVAEPGDAQGKARSRFEHRQEE